MGGEDEPGLADREFQALEARHPKTEIAEPEFTPERNRGRLVLDRDRDGIGGREGEGGTDRAREAGWGGEGEEAKDRARELLSGLVGTAAIFPGLGNA